MGKDAINYETLIAYAAGELPTEAVRQVEAYLARSPEAAATVKRIRVTIQTMHADDSVAPPPESLARAKAIFAAATESVGLSWLDRLGRLIADLVFDSRAQPAPAGVRGIADGFQLAYESPAAEVDLELLPDAADRPVSWTLLGQISLPTPAADLLVALVSHADQLVLDQIEPDRHGVFRLQLSPGVYDLVIRVAQQALVLPKIELN